MSDLYVQAGRETGPGKFEQQIKDGRTILQNYWLYNYNIDGNQLKPEHKTVILNHILPTLRKTNSHIKLFGFASKTGDAAYNQRLSESRVLHTKAYLQSFGFDESQVVGNEMRAFGEQFSNGSSKPNEYYRAVKIVIMTRRLRGSIPTIPPPQIIPPEPPPDETIVFPPIIVSPPKPSNKSSSWSIKYDGGLRYSAGSGVEVGAVTHKFILRNNKTGEYHSCVFGGGGYGFGVPTPLIVSGSITLESDLWTDFRTSKRISYSKFSNGVTTWTAPPLTAPHVIRFPYTSTVVYVPTGFPLGIPGTNTDHGVVQCIEGTSTLPP